MRFLFRLDLSLHAGAGNFFWNLEVCNKHGPSKCGALERHDGRPARRAAVMMHAWKSEGAESSRQVQCRHCSWWSAGSPLQPAGAVQVGSWQPLRRCRCMPAQVLSRQTRQRGGSGSGSAINSDPPVAAVVQVNLARSLAPR